MTPDNETKYRMDVEEQLDSITAQIQEKAARLNFLSLKQMQLTPGPGESEEMLELQSALKKLEELQKQLKIDLARFSQQ